MSFEFLVDPESGPQWRGVLPGRPEPYVLRRGEGEHAVLFQDLFTVLLSGDETEGQFGIITTQCPAGDLIPSHSHHRTHETFVVLDGVVTLFFADAEGVKRRSTLSAGDFGFVPAGHAHAYRVDEAAHMMGVLTGGFERFFQDMGQATDHPTPPHPVFVPDRQRMQAAAESHAMTFLPDYDWSDAQG